MRTTIDLPDPLFRQLKAKAALEGTSLKELVTECVQRGLAGRSGFGTVDSPRQRTRLPTIFPSLGRRIAPLSNREIDDILTDEAAQK